MWSSFYATVEMDLLRNPVPRLVHRPNNLPLCGLHPRHRSDEGSVFCRSHVHAPAGLCNVDGISGLAVRIETSTVCAARTFCSFRGRLVLLRED